MVFIRNKLKSIIIFTLLHLLSLNLFLQGFFPMKKNIPGFSTFDEYGVALKKENLDVVRNYNHAQFDRMVFIVIDALRDSFILEKEFFQNMKFTSNLVSKASAQVYRSKANAPTVTLPRIKALLTGSIPGFSDVITNLNAKALNEDNWLCQLTMQNKTVVFYGDDTWIKLFPNKFKRQDGTTSFYVSDYTEVDLNVTRHINSEMANKSVWDVMILHYLGLDHIGHLAGPYSNLVPEKLKEMDQVISRIYSGLYMKDKHDGKKSLVILTGDHGMSNSGSHGGATPSEVSTPLLIIPVTENLSKPVNVTVKDVQQIDIAPTISALLNLPIPLNNLGKVILPAINYPVKDKILWMFYNVQQITQVFRQYSSISFETCECYNSYKYGISLHKKLSKGLDVDHKQILDAYIETIDCLKEKIESKLINYDMYAIYFGILLFVMGFFSLIIELLRNETVFNNTKLSIVTVTAFILLFFHLIICTGCCSSSILCSNLFYTVTSFLTLIWYVMSIVNMKLSFFKSLFHLIGGISLSDGILIGASLIQVFSLGSSSFIEEEHQIWYFFISTWCIIILFNSSKKLLSNWTSNLDTSSKIPGFSWFIVLILMRLLRRWNQTGDKWAHLPDIGDYLNKMENVGLLSILVAVSLVVTSFILAQKVGFLRKILVYMAVFFIYIVKVKNGSLSFKSSLEAIIPISSVIVARLVLIIVVVILIVTAFSAYNKEKMVKLNEISTVVVISWSLLVLMLFKPHNIPLFAMLVLIEYILRQFCILSGARVAIIYFWFASTSFFLQGNSASLSTVDVSAGYVCLTEHQPVIVGILMACNTYSCYVFWLLSLFSLFTSLNYNSSKGFVSDINQMTGMLILYKSFVVLFYSIVITTQRYHLFIWTVFSPKMLYEAMSSIILTACILFVSTTMSAIIEEKDCETISS